MINRIDAIFENGVFRPDEPVNIPNGQRVSLRVESELNPVDDLGDVADLLDAEFTKSCRQQAGRVPSLEEVRTALSVFKGSVSDLILEERDER